MYAEYIQQIKNKQTCLTLDIYGKYSVDCIAIVVCQTMLDQYYWKGGHGWC